jgi:DNA-binding NarL/FixJ family response regulator
MQTDASAQLVGQEELVRKLRALLSHISDLRSLVREDEDGDAETPDVPYLSALRQGLHELEQMAGELLSTWQTQSEFRLANLPPGLPLAEALSQLVEASAEKLELSSRLVFSGRERPLSNYLSRLLYTLAQEALTQVSAHAGARRLRFSLDYQSDEVIMGIEDDGLPHSENQLMESISDENSDFLPFLSIDRAESENETLDNQLMDRMRVIVEGLGGVLLVNSSVEHGTQIQVHMPYKASEDVKEQFTPPVIVQKKVEAFTKIKVLIVDAQAVSRAGLRHLLESYEDLHVVGEAEDSVQAISETAELLPQIVLIDAQLPGEQSLEIVGQIRQLNAEIHTLLLSGQEDAEFLYKVLRAGAGGYVLKNIAPDELAQAVRTVAHGEILVQPQLAVRLLTRLGEQNSHSMTRLPQESLTAREREVLQLLARGLRNKEIAARLFVSERTVNFHLANIYAKLQVSGRTEALSRALEQGLLKV